MKIRFLGHAAFQVLEDDTYYLFDPFLKGNPVAQVSPEQVRADYIFISHAHDDHLGDAEEIARKNNSLVITTFEVGNMLAKFGVRVHQMHVGGTYNFDFGRVRITQALHGSGVPGGLACGFIITINGKTLYFAGDTGLFGDMQLLGEIEDIDLALLPIGGNYTMDAADAVRAVQFLRPRRVIPMHYNTMPVIKADPVRFKNEVEAQTETECVLLNPGEEWELK